MPLDKVNVTLADARPELVWNQLTGGSNSMHSIFTPVRVAAALAKGQLLQAAAAELGGDVAEPHGRERSDHSAERTRPRRFGLADAARPRSRRRRRRDRDAQARVAVQAGRHAAAPDRRARHRHRPQAVRDGPRRPGRAADDGVPPADDQRERQIGQQPGPGRGDARRHRRRDHPAHRVRPRRRRGPRARRSASASTRSARSTSTWGRRHGRRQVRRRTCSSALKAAELPLTPALPVATTLDQRFTFYFRPGDPLETNCAIADVKPGSAEIWSSLKSPIWAQEQIAENLGIAADERHVPRHAGRRLVRPPPVRRRRVRGRRDLAEARQAGEADVAPDRQLPPGPHPPDVHLARAGRLLGRERGELRPAAYERRHRLHPRARGAAERHVRASCPSRTRSASRRPCSP